MHFRSPLATNTSSTTCWECGPCTDCVELWGGIACGIFGLKALGGMGGVSFVSAACRQHPRGQPSAPLPATVICTAVDMLLGLRLTPDEERRGADLAVHKIGANPEEDACHGAASRAQLLARGAAAIMLLTGARRAKDGGARPTLHEWNIHARCYRPAKPWLRAPSCRRSPASTACLRASPRPAEGHRDDGRRSQEVMPGFVPDKLRGSQGPAFDLSQDPRLRMICAAPLRPGSAGATGWPATSIRPARFIPSMARARACFRGAARGWPQSALLVGR